MKHEHISGCPETRERLDPYLDGELTQAERATIDTHLASCPGCTEELKLRAGLKRRVREAVRKAATPAGLETSIRGVIRVRQNEASRPWFGSLYRIAAGVVLLTLAGLGGSQLKQRFDQERLIDRLSAQIAQVFRAGFGDHLHCALFREAKHPVVQDLIERTLVEPLGPEYEEVRRLVAQRPPDDLEIWMAHRCEFRKREFVHVALRGEGKLLSVILTRKWEGESFPESEQQAVQVSAELTLHKAAVDQFQAAGFESSGHLVFVISNLSEAANLEVASAVGPKLDHFLKTGPV